MKYYISLGYMYLQSIHIDVTCSDTEFIESLEFCTDKSDIFTSATFDNERKAISVADKIVTILGINREDIAIISEKSDSNE